MRIPVWDEVALTVSDLTRDRSSWLAHWRELGEYTAPRRGRFLGQGDHNDGRKRNEKILNSNPIAYLNTVAAGLADGLTPRRKRWFRLIVPDPELAADGAVQRWLYVLEDRMWQVLQRSNLYNAFGLMYQDLPRFGTACMVIDEDPEAVCHAHVIPPGSYALGNDARGRVRYFYREFQMTVAQMVEQFGLGALSQQVQQLAREKKWNTWRPIFHLIAPNTFDGAGAEDLPLLPYVSLTWEAGNPERKFARASGYRVFPVIAPRWQVEGEDVYGGCPGMDALGDIKMLQLMERDKLELIALLNKPPMGAPISLRSQPRSLMPGTWTFYDSTQEHRAAPLFQSSGSLQEMGAEIRAVEARIKTILKADMFTVLTGSERQITAFEAERLIQEGLQQVGPTVERLMTEMLDPTIDRVFDIMDWYNLVPPPPEILQGRPLRVEYVSNLANYYRRQEVGDTQLWLSITRDLADMDPTALDVLDTEATVRGLAERYAVPPNYTRTREQVEERAAARAEREALLEGASAAKPMADAAEKLAAIDPNKASLLQRVLANAPAAQA